MTTREMGECFVRVGNLPENLRRYLCVLVGERPIQDLQRVCSQDVLVRLDAKSHVRGIEAARELIAHRRERLEGPAIAVARSVEDEARGKCVKVNQAVHVRAGKKMINGINIPSFLFVTGNYYLSDDGRLREIQECWPKWLAGSFPLRMT